MYYDIIFKIGQNIDYNENVSVTSLKKKNVVEVDETNAWPDLGVISNFTCQYYFYNNTRFGYMTGFCTRRTKMRARCT